MENSRKGAKARQAAGWLLAVMMTLACLSPAVRPAQAGSMNDGVVAVKDMYTVVKGATSAIGVTTYYVYFIRNGVQTLVSVIEIIGAPPAPLVLEQYLAGTLIVYAVWNAPLVNGRSLIENVQVVNQALEERLNQPLTPQQEWNVYLYHNAPRQDAYGGWAAFFDSLFGK